MPDNNSSIPPLILKKTSYEELDTPVFQSTIPPTLLDKVPPEMKWIMDSLSKLSQAVDWLCRSIQEDSKHIKETDTRTIENSLILLTLREEQHRLEDRMNILEAKYIDRFGQQAANKEGKKEDNVKENSFDEFMGFLSQKWFWAIVAVLILIGVALGSTVGMSGLVKFLAKFFV